MKFDKRKLVFLKRLINTQFLLLTLAVVFVTVAASIVWHRSNKNETLIIAAGPKSGLSFSLVQSITKVMKEDHFIDLQMIETRDGEEGTKLLEEGLVQFAVAQTKSLHGDEARLVASLYPDSYQLLVHQDSAIRHFTDLRGKKIAMQNKGGAEHEAFWELAKHYGMEPTNMTVYASGDKASDWMFLNGQVDAIFRVRAPGDQSIKKLINYSKVRFIPLEQVEGIRISSPTRQANVIAKGVYQGHPAVPDRDVPTISEKELLIASASVPSEIIEKLSTTLFEGRKKLTNLAPMAAFIEQPKKDGELLIPIHEGVRKFWQRTEPPFLQKNADLIAMVSSMGFFLFSAVMWYRNNQRRQMMFQYNRQLMELALQVKHLETAEELESKSKDFDLFLIELVKTTEKGQINMQDYTALSYSYEAVKTAFADKRNYLRGHHA